MSNLIFIIMVLTASISLTGVLVFIGVMFLILILFGFAGNCIEKNSINKISDPEKRKYSRNYYEEHGYAPYKDSEMVGQAQLLGLITLILTIGIIVVFFIVIF